MPGMNWSSVLNSPSGGPGVALATSVTLTDISPAPQLTLPAGFLGLGSRLRLTAWGVYSDTTTPTLLIGFYYGGVAGTALCSIPATTLGSTVSNKLFKAEATMEVVAVGATGSARVAGHVDLDTVRVPTATPQTAVTIDTTSAKTITVGAQWGTSSASNTVQLMDLIVESIGF
jgi:hypothetical protein